ncbi:MAG: hypothetical protein Q9M31_06065 [Mariprofundus sp.]|nr:hypothetical protein [Mariprofundus sp.]
MKHPHQWHKIILLLPLFALSSCASIIDNVNATPSHHLANKDASHSNKSIAYRIKRIDQASDRMTARNDIMHELIQTSNQTCEHILSKLPKQIKRWNIESEKSNNSSLLEDTIERRKFDNVDPSLALQQSIFTHPAKQELARAITAMIKKNRYQLYLTLRNREDMDISQYSLKQALQNLVTYQHACSVEQGISDLALASTQQHTTIEEKQAQIESLIKLRQTLIEQRLGTQAIQQQIDAIIMSK